jgi:membrane-associated phospholipid phosphatase
LSIQQKIIWLNLKKRENKTTIFYIILAWIIGAFLLESSDLWISIKFYNPNAEWAIFIEKFGEIPGLLLVLAGLYIYSATLKSPSNIKKILISAILLTAGSLITVYVLLLLSNGIVGSSSFFNLNRIYFFIAAVFLNIFISFLFRKQKTYSAKAILFSKLSFSTFIYGIILFIQPLKIFWGRIRFRDLSENYTNFTTWYIPNGITGNDSFPSGHAAISWMFLSLFVLFTEQSIGKRIALRSLIIIWAITVCASRVVIGAHYASDVFFGSFITILSYYFVLESATNKNRLSKI